jgi:hypothetical protein
MLSQSTTIEAVKVIRSQHKNRRCKLSVEMSKRAWQNSHMTMDNIYTNTGSDMDIDHVCTQELIAAALEFIL